MNKLFDVSFGRNATIRGDARIKRVRHYDLPVEIDGDDELGIVVNLDGAHRFEGRVDGKFRSEVPRPGSVSVLPPFCRCRFRLTGECSVVMLRIAWRNLTQRALQAGRDPDKIAIALRINDDEPALARLVLRAVTADLPMERDEATGGLIGHLVARPARLASRRPSIGLSALILKRTVDRMQTRSAAPPSLSDLARDAGLSPYHFTRCFRQATGLAPHQYLLRCQIERTMDLLARTDWPIGAIARHAGFSHAAHQARHFRRATGLPPSNYRQQVLP